MDSRKIKNLKKYILFRIECFEIAISYLQHLLETLEECKKNSNSDEFDYLIVRLHNYFHSIRQDIFTARRYLKRNFRDIFKKYEKPSY